MELNEVAASPPETIAREFSHIADFSMDNLSRDRFSVSQVSVQDESESKIIKLWIQHLIFSIKKGK